MISRILGTSTPYSSNGYSYAGNVYDKFTVELRYPVILQPQSKLTELECWLQANQYMIEDARLCVDGGKLYLALSVLGGAAWNQNTEDILCIKRDPIFREYVQNEIRKTEYARAGLQKSPREHQDLIDAMEQRISVLTQYEKEISKW